VVGSNISFFGEQLACKILVEDMYAEVEAHAKAGTRETLPVDLVRRLKREPASVDGIFCWDLFDYLDRPSSQALAAHLVALLRPGGVLYGFSGARTAYAVEAALCLAGWVLYSLIGYSHRPRPAREGSTAENLTVGIRFLLTQPELLGAQLLDLFSVLFGGAPALLPIFTSEILRVGPEGLGVLRAAPAAGAVVMSVFLAHRRLRRAGRTLYLCVAAFGLCWIFFALSRSFWLSLALLALSGMVDNVSVVIRSTLLTLRTPEPLLGRVSAVNQIFIGSSNEIGSFESGVAAKLLTPVVSVVLGGLASLGVVGGLAVGVPRLRRLGRIDELTPTAPG
jgi:hypothetical protein